ncbi:hypothetical protein CEP52_011051 [Fusarium oligoseptatum]|uniref:DUF7357 domain-containing protein n=1 Tax=Fusarium oligoseptatum TaxID=2604345 RepID=A0A428T583_9HYPO|nr:hypothetical protein CEP52_011051 [Fusarium oligoseptatum]
MPSQAIRLRLVVRRHAVPEVKLVWPCVASDDLTVSKLLAQVNEVIPLESGDWGLEDYAVELADDKGDSFELLHFQQVGKVLKADDQVFVWAFPLALAQYSRLTFNRIRSLLTDDLRRRRLSGRHQISEDGKHLIDGLAFGRPWLRQPRDRPSLDLPPRKRARITHEEELDEQDDSYAEEEDQSEQLLLEDSASHAVDEPGSVTVRARFIDIDPTVGFEEDEIDNDDRDFIPTRNVEAEPAMDDEVDEISDEEEPDVDLTEELRLLQEDNALVEQTPPVEQHTLLSSNNNSQDPQALLPAYTFDLSLLDKITALRAAFPLTSISTIQSELLRHEKDLRTTFQALAKSNEPTLSFDEVMDRALLGINDSDDQSGVLRQESPRLGDFGPSALQFPGRPEPVNPSRPLIEEVEFAEDPVPNLISQVESEPRTAPLISVVEEEASSDTSSSSSDSDSESGSDDDSKEDSDSDDSADSSSDSDSDSESDSDDSDDSPRFPRLEERKSLFSSHYDNAMDTSSSDDSDSSASDSDSDSDVGGGRVAAVGKSDSDGSDASSDSSSSSDSTKAQKSPPKPPQPSAPPLVVEIKAADNLSQSTEGPAPGAGLSRTKKRNARRRETKRLKALQALGDTPSQSSVNGDVNEEAELLARKRALLSVVSDDHEDQAAASSTEMVVDHANGTEAAALVDETPAPAAEEAVSSTEPKASSRRLKVDMGAGRRLLLGALGLKNPKSKAEEDKLRKNLMKDVKPLENPRVQSKETTKNDTIAEPEQPDEDPNAWREKISYRAVECCHEGMVLSEPPFPFVQRWDPQQQYGSMRKRKRTSQNFYDESYYDENDQAYGDEAEWNDDSQQKKKKKKKKKSKKGMSKGDSYDEDESLDSHFDARQESTDADVVLNYDDVPAKGNLESSQFTDMDDLPSLPSDITALPSVDFSEVKPGMVITWKQLLLSKATNWQPEILPVTGMVLSVDADNTLHVLLAKRDREQNDKEYDQHTGKRVYAKFEAPDLDEDEDEEDDGRREIFWAEMSDPRMVQQAPSPSMLETSTDGPELATEKKQPAKNGDSAEDNKVSERQDHDGTKTEELGTQEVRAEVEADPRERAAAAKAVESTNSTSIPSGQALPRLELTTSGDDTPISSLVRNADTPSDMVNSPSRQLQETLHAAIAREENPLSHDSEGVTAGEVEKEADEIGDAEDVDMMESSAGVEGTELDAIIPDSIASPELPPLPLKNMGPIDHRTLAVPSSVGSIRSGRQPPSINGLEDLPEECVEDSVVAETVQRPNRKSPSPRPSLRSSSPFPSLEEIFHTAATSRQTQSPARWTQQSVLQSLKPGKGDLEYEEAMRKLDEGEDDSDRSPDRNKSLRSLFPNATQPEPSKSLSSLQPVKKVKRESPFVIPEGSQVIELSSSPPSVQFVEHYADDSVDGTYQDNSMPQGSGWVQKNFMTRSRGKSVPAAAASASNSTSSQTRPARGRTSLPPARDVTASAYSQIKGRRRTTRKF